MKFARLTIVLLLVSGVHTFAMAQSMTLVSLLFPESLSWTTLDALPPVKPSEMSSFLAQALWGAIPTDELQNVASAGTSNQGNSEVSLFFGPNGTRGFYHFPRSGYGGSGILYSGGSPCCDGDTTIFWPDTSDDGRMLPAHAFPGVIVKIENSPTPRVVDYEAGDGWAPATYSLLPIECFNRWNPWNVDIRLTLPDGIKPAHKAMTFSTSLTLRSAPLVNDAYDPDLSHFLNVAVFGNVERRYLPDVKATIVGTWTDKTGQLWNLLTVKDRDNAYLATYTSHDVEVGWAEAQ